MSHRCASALVLPVPAPAAISNAGGSASPSMPYSTALRCPGLRLCRCRRPSIGCRFVFLFRSCDCDRVRQGRNARGSVGENAPRAFIRSARGRVFARLAGRIEHRCLAVRAPLRPHPGRTSRYSTLRWSGFSVMVQCPPRACEKAEDFHQKRNGGPTVGRPQAPERRATAQPMRWYRLSYRANVTTVRHGQRTPPAGVKRWA